MNRRHQIHSLLTSLRIANAPSVISNVWLGFMLGWWIWLGSVNATLKCGWRAPIGLCLCGLMLYFAGNLANDWWDRHWDQERRPERALPSGAFPVWSYITGALLLAISAISLALKISTASGYVALALLGFITIYTYFHKKTPWAAIAMGLCRASLYPMAALIRWGWWEKSGEPLWSDSSLKFIAFILTHSSGLLSYICGLTLLARYETMENPPRRVRNIGVTMVIYPIMAMAAYWMPYYPWVTLISILPYAVWLWISLKWLKRPLPRLISALLAGIPLLDFITLLPLSLAMVPMGGSVLDHPILMINISLPLVAFVLSRFIQKISSAT
jgi:4-hydroxybenzoate polyprenyltransferase